MISVVKANGILIPKEEMLIREVAQAEGKDDGVTVAIIKQELEASEEDSEPHSLHKADLESVWIRISSDQGFQTLHYKNAVVQRNIFSVYQKNSQI